jgi:hypothetical protein
MTPSGRPPTDEPGERSIDGRASVVAAGSPAGVADRPEPEAIFVVGLPRSGTTLMRMVLESHSRIAITGESHYLGRLVRWRGARRDFRRAGDVRDDAAVQRLVERIYSEEFQRGSRLRETSSSWRWLARYVPRAELEQRLLAGERSERGVYTAVLRAYADRRRKPIFGDKTPSHIRWAETLLEWYPTARIIHMVRDPRAVYRSQFKHRKPEAVPYRWLLRVPWMMRAFILLEATWLWADAVSRHRTLSRRYPANYRMVRFEDLVRDPEAEIRRLCEFLGVQFEPAMLGQKVVSKGDRLADAAFDAGAADRWRASISTADARWLAILLGRRIEEMGYSQA